MPQYPVKSQSYARSPNDSLKQTRSDALGTVYAAVSPGNRFLVNETTGLDTNDGSLVSPFKTLAAAEAAAIANNGDVVFVEGTIHVSATVVFAKNGVSWVGVESPSNNCRSRISQTGSVVFSPLVSVTAEGCRFENLGTFHGFASDTAQVCWADSGGRNFYDNVQFFGGGDATAAANAGCRSFVGSGSGESKFENCTFGLDTVNRATNANATIEFTGGSARYKFTRCTFQMLSKLAGMVHIKTLAASLDRDAIFDDCFFLNAVESTATVIDQVVSANAATGGGIILRNPLAFGATALAAAGPVYVVGSTPVATTSGIAIKAT